VATVAGMDAGINTTQVVTPYLFYENVGDAIDWLVRVLGFRERMRLTVPGGFVAHAEVGMGDGVVMIGNVGARPSNVRSSVYIFVDHVDAHFEHSRESFRRRITVLTAARQAEACRALAAATGC
jgi:uncharacterized glyoxalase superfamily protein PhnB